MPRMLISLELHVVDVQTGHWCPWCALPSAVAVTFAVVDSATLQIVGRKVETICDECDQMLARG